MSDDPAADKAGARQRVEKMTYALGIALYLADDGTISQHGPGERIEPAKGAVPLDYGHGRGPQTAATP